jgi:hypothetical protein
MALPFIAAAQDAGHYKKDWANSVYWTGLLVLILPIMSRLASPMVARSERVYLLMLLAVSSFLVKLLYAPTRFAHFDEFLHWLTATDIMGLHRLFSPNSLLPVSPAYPGLEILTTAVANLSGLSIFGASVVVLLVIRPLFISALFLFYERICGCSRMAAIACLAYMGNSGYMFFESQYAYESLAIVLLGLALFSDSIARDNARQTYASTAIVLALVVALCATHHVTSYVALIVFALLAVLESLRSRDKSARTRAVLLAAFVLISIVVWAAISGKSITSYLGPPLQHAIDGFLRMIKGTPSPAGSAPRKAFEAADGFKTPMALQVIGIVSLLIVALGLATGFLRSLALAASGFGRTGWAALLDFLRGRVSNTRLGLLTLLTLCWPLSVVLRLSAGGWEIGNRMGPFVFLGVGIVIAAGIIHFWDRVFGRVSPFVIGWSMAILFLGGVITGWGFSAAGTPYRVSADAASVEPMGIEAASWSQQWLGRGNKFATDRPNQILLATYGKQVVSSSLDGEGDYSYIFVGEGLSENELAIIRSNEIHYLLVDLRLTQALPAFGSYFGSGEDDEIHEHPPDPRAFLKFSDMPHVSRVYDNGWIDIFDISGLGNAP